MDSISDSDSEDAGSIPAGATPLKDRITFPKSRIFPANMVHSQKGKGLSAFFLIVFFALHISCIAQNLNEKDTIKIPEPVLSKPAFSVETISSNQLPTVPSFSLDQGLIGKVAGAMFTSVNGTPGAPVNIQLRGINTIVNGTLPLILVDGAQLGTTRINALDPSLIDRVEIIQGAAAAAMYGYQGANGVITIFTKRGESGKLRIDISSSISRNMIIDQNHLQKSRLHSYSTDASGNMIDSNGSVITQSQTDLTLSGAPVRNLIDPNNIYTKIYKGNFSYHDHIAEFFKPSYATTNRITLSGGGKKADALFSFSNNKLENTFAHDGHNSRTNLALNLGVSITKRLNVRSVTQIAFTENTVNYFDQTSFAYLLRAQPYADFSLKDTNGNYGYIYSGSNPLTGANPHYFFQYSNRKNNNTDIIQSFNATYKLFRFLILDAKYGVNSNQSNEKINIGDQTANQNSIQSRSHIYVYNGLNATGEKLNNQGNYSMEVKSIEASFNLDLKKDFGLSFPIKSTTRLKAEWRKGDYNQSKATTPLTNYSTGHTLFKTYSLIYYHALEYNNWLGISGAIRKDYFLDSPDKTFRQGTIQAVISQLNFWRNSKFLNNISMFRIRGAVGKAGVQAILFTDPYYTESSGQPLETSTESEAGIDISKEKDGYGWFKNIMLSLTRWERTTPRSEYPTVHIPSSGYYPGILPANAIFTLASEGYQISFNSTVYTGKQLQWNFIALFGKQVTKTESNSQGGFSAAAAFTNGNEPDVYFQANKIFGQLQGSIFLTSVDQKDKNGNYFIPQAQQSNFIVASNGYVVDRASKMPYSPSSTYPLGNPLPKFNFSFINEIKWKSWVSLAFQWDWTYKSHLYNRSKEIMYIRGVHTDFNRPITIDNVTGAWTAFYYGIPFYGPSSHFYEDASFLRLRNVSFKFELKQLMKFSKLRTMQLELSGRNLLTFTKYSGMDPEVNSGSIHSSWNRGVDNATIPNLRSYQIGLNIGL